MPEVPRPSLMDVARWQEEAAEKQPRQRTSLVTESHLIPAQVQQGREAKDCPECQQRIPRAERRDARLERRRNPPLAAVSVGTHLSLYLETPAAVRDPAHYLGTVDPSRGRGFLPGAINRAGVMGIDPADNTLFLLNQKIIYL
ncbi:unnamed protein product [Lota lota]